MISALACLVLMILPAQDTTVTDAFELLIDRLLTARGANVYQVETDAAGGLRIDAAEGLPAGAWDVVRKTHSGRMIEYYVAGRFDAEAGAKLSSINADFDIRKGDILVPSGRRPVVVLSVVPSDGISGHFLRFLEAQLGGEIERTGVLHVALDDGDRQTSLFPDEESLTAVRAGLDGQRQDMRLLVYPAINGSRLQLVCRTICADQTDDEVFESSVFVSQSFAEMLEAETRAEATAGVYKSAVQAAVTQDAISITAVDTDGDGSDEIAVLTPARIFILANRDGKLQAAKSVMLTGISRAEHATRIPWGQLTPVDIDDDGAEELLFSSNLLRHGGIVDFSGEGLITEIQLQPLAALTESAGTTLLAGSFLPGENNLGVECSMLDLDGASVSPATIAQGGKLVLTASSNGKRYLHRGIDGEMYIADLQDASVRTHLFAGMETRDFDYDRTSSMLVLAGLAGRGGRSPGTRGDSVFIFRLEGDTPRLVTSFSTPLDIRGVAIYNSNTTPEIQITVLGLNGAGVLQIDLYQQY